ncbi:MAG TPA: radical SAM protein, partial [Methanomassiliicoccales archaeon]|nr:radical SAM protein [Methanomassiliicoccales archaeon]
QVLSGIARLGVDVLHLDNANPAVISTYPMESKAILESMAKHCTSGNVLALGLESADPKVHEMNNLNATAEQTLEAIRLINQVGRERGPNGLPKLLPGVNFVVGLDGESEGTLQMDLGFLRNLLEEGLLVRRINIRQVSGIRREFRGGVGHSRFLRFKNAVRTEIDHEMLRRLVPQGTVLRNVYTELVEGKVTFGRQIGTYPLLVGIEHILEKEKFLDVKVTGWGYRSITGVEYPLHINDCPIGAIESLPGVGRKRAMRLFRARKFAGADEFVAAMDDPKLARDLLEYITFD